MDPVTLGAAINAALKNVQDITRGEPGVSPAVTITNITGGHRVTITDADGAHSFDVPDGAQPVSPTVTVTNITGGHRLTITDVNGTNRVDIMDGVTPSGAVVFKATYGITTYSQISAAIERGEIVMAYDASNGRQYNLGRLTSSTAYFYCYYPYNDTVYEAWVVGGTWYYESFAVVRMDDISHETFTFTISGQDEPVTKEMMIWTGHN